MTTSSGAIYFTKNAGMNWSAQVCLVSCLSVDGVCVRRVAFAPSFLAYAALASCVPDSITHSTIDWIIDRILLRAMWMQEASALRLPFRRAQRP